MKLADLFRLTALLRRLSREPTSGVDPRVDAQLDQRGAERGVAFDIYRPRGRPRGVVVAVHGATRQGPRDRRLIHFAKNLARSGVLCATPHLPGLAACRWCAEDIDYLADCAATLAAESGERPGLIGFSFGGSFALVAAARPRIAERVRFVLTFGAYHSLETLFEHFVAIEDVPPKNEAQWDEHIYLRLVLAHQYADEADLPRSLRAEVDDLLCRYCGASSPEQKRAFYDEHLARRDLLGIGVRHLDPELLAALSPAAQLDGLRCPVSLVHDVADPLIPKAQAEALYAELSGLPRSERFRLLVTPLVSHVDLGSLLRVGEIGRFLSVMAPLIQASK